MESESVPTLYPRWKRNDIIRHKATGHPYKVLHLFKNCSTLLEDLQDRAIPRGCFNLDPSHYDEFCVDTDLELKENKWVYNQITL